MICVTEIPFDPSRHRTNGLPPAAPVPGRRILVAGGAGYIGCVLVPRLLERGYEVRVLDRLYFGEEPLDEFRDRIELVCADVRDVSDAMIAAYEAPAEKVRGEIFNVLHSNYQIRELAMLVAGSVQLTGRRIELVEVEAPRLTRDYECSNSKLAATLGFIPRHSVLEAVTDLLERIDHEDRAKLTDPRTYNIRWLELLTEVKPQLEQFASVL